MCTHFELLRFDSELSDTDSDEEDSGGSDEDEEEKKARKEKKRKEKEKKRKTKTIVRNFALLNDVQIEITLYCYVNV